MFTQIILLKRNFYAFKYLGVVITTDGSGNNDIDTWIGKANVFMRELYRSAVTKRDLSNTAKLSVSNRPFFRSSPTVMNLW